MENRNNALISLIILVLTPLVAGDDEASLSQSSSLVIASHCSSKCGDVTIPYPFGIEEGCYYAVDDNPSFSHPKKINCNYTFSPPKPFIGRNVHVTNISMEESEIWINGGVAVRCYGKDGYLIGGKNRSLEMVNYTISSAKNMFVATGCDTYAWFTGTRYGKPYKTGCMTTCNELDDVVDNQCNGVGCCQVSIPDGVTNLKVNAYSFDNHTNVDFNPCSAAYLVAKDWFKFKKDELMETLDFYNGKDEIPTILNWGIGSKKCSAAIKDGDCLCKNNTDCINLKDQDGYRCKCKDGYIGNPYLPRGCTGNKTTPLFEFIFYI